MSGVVKKKLSAHFSFSCPCAARWLAAVRIRFFHTRISLADSFLNLPLAKTLTGTSLDLRLISPSPALARHAGRIVYKNKTFLSCLGDDKIRLDNESRTDDHTYKVGQTKLGNPLPNIIYRPL
jgi:hypothetical protein